LIVIIVAVGVLLCCCALIVAAALAGILGTAPISREGGIGRVTERTEQTFNVGDAPTLGVETFAGNVTVRRGESGQVRIVLTKRAANSNRLEAIDIDIEERDDEVRIQASKPSGLTSNVSVSVEMYVPADAELDLETGAGNVRVNGVDGEIAAHTGAGNVTAEGATGPVALDTGAGNVRYEGEPMDRCTFKTGTGNITLVLPGDVDAEVELDTGIGNIDLGGFNVAGDVSRTEVEGRLGTGEDATIRAETGAGNINLEQ
jgi:DUF4097 and DUF4098 domain-containing protein YvlB